MNEIDPADIKALRLRRGWTQAELAGRLGTDPVTVSRWERGVSRPRRSARVRLRALFSDRPAGSATFTTDPEDRLRAVDRARREQLELKG